MNHVTVLIAGLVMLSQAYDQQYSESKIQNKTNLKNTNKMETKDYTLTILVDKTPAEAFNAIKNLRGWWSENIDGETSKPGETFFYHYQDTHLANIKFVELVPDKRIVYQVLANDFSFVKDKTEWVNNKLAFDISTEGKQTKITFTHQGLASTYECYKPCVDAWTGLIQNSLIDFINTGKGHPIPKDSTQDMNSAHIKEWRSRN